MSKIDTNVLHNGQLAVATIAQSGEVIQDGGEIDATSVIQTDNGPQKVVKVLDLNGGGGGGTSDYSDLSNKPQINGTTLSGNKSSSDLGVADTSLSNLTDAGKIQAAHLAMPSDTKTSLTYVVETLMTAPADGYITLKINYGTQVQIAVYPASTTQIDSTLRVLEIYQMTNNNAWAIFAPISKGQKFTVYGPEDSTIVTAFYFTYAKGSESEKQGA